MLLVFLLFFAGLTGTPPDDAIATTLLEQGRRGESPAFIIVMREQADLSSVSRIRGKEAKGERAFTLLRETAARTQGPVLDVLRAEGAPIHAFYVANLIRSQGDLALMRRLAALPEVAYLAADAPVMLTDYREEPAAAETRGFEEVTWGIARIGADSVWAMGYTGQGVVVGGQDTGYEWTHPALRDNYRGWNNGVAEHDYSWHDAIYAIDPLHNDSVPDPSKNPCGLQSPEPCDDNNHGTHTMGTMVGVDSTLQIGVAPGARWIGCRNMERGWGNPSSYIECFEWFLAPTDLQNEFPRPDLAPHVIANSWACPPIEGCEPSNFALMEMVVDNLKAAGVVVVVSAGNSGSGCASVETPAAIFESSFVVGATRNEDTIAGFSSRGPVLVDGSGRLKPDISAPGVQVRSAIRNGGYAQFSGTSMAGPHVAGAVALLISANPELAGEVDVIQALLQEESLFLAGTDTCEGISGEQRPNTTYGWGRLDIHAAVRKALEGSTAWQPVPVQPARIYPNPFREVLHLQLPEGSETGVFLLFDAAGRQVWSHTLSGSALHLLQAPRLPDGMYSYQLRVAGKHYAGVLIRQ